MNNKNISVWRGDNTPPTLYHLWLKNNGKLYVNIDEQWLEIDKDSISLITEILNLHTAKLDNHLTALNDINTLHSKLWTPGKGNWSIMSQGVKNSIGEDLTKGALGTYSYAEGLLTTATGDASHAEGLLSRATAIHAHAEGFDSEAGGEKSHAEGYQTVTSAVGSHAEGFKSHAENVYSHAEGNTTIASGPSSHAEGVQSEATGEGAHAEGGSSLASGLFSHAENGGRAFGAFSHAEGGSYASGEYSHAEGSGCRMEDNPEGESKIGSYCHVEGLGTICISKGGHTEGNGTYVAGDFAHAEGISSRADGTASHAEGKNTIANGDSAHAQGRFNVGSKYYIHSTGIGNENERKNAECIYVNTDNMADPRNGYTYIYGIGDYDGISTDVTTYKSLLEVISNIDSTLTVKADLVDGKIPLELLGNLDIVLFEVVRELPTTNIKKHIYLMKVSELESGAKNLYAEYIYTGDITATYDASKWEKLGVKLIETDLSDYYTKEETDNLILIAKNSAINIHNEDNTKSIKLDINDTENEGEYGGAVNVSLIDHDDDGYINIANINAYDGFRHINDNGDFSNLYSGGLYISSGTNRSDVRVNWMTMSNETSNFVVIGNYDGEHNEILLGSDTEFKISRPKDNTEGATITGVKSIAAFANPSATKVWATDGSTVDLTTKANASDLDAKANASDVLLKKSADGGYYIEENDNTVGKKAFAANTNCIASGSWAFAEGVSNALIYCAHSEGYYTTATGFASHALGSYNITNQNAIHSVGIGDSTTRKNAEYIYVKNNKNSSAIVNDPKNGYKYLIGVGGYDGISTDNSTYKSVQEVIADLENNKVDKTDITTITNDEIDEMFL